MSETKINVEEILERVCDMEQRIELLKHDLIKGIEPYKGEVKASLYGSVRGDDISEEMIDEAKHSLFRNIEDI